MFSQGEGPWFSQVRCLLHEQPPPNPLACGESSSPPEGGEGLHRAIISIHYEMLDNSRMIRSNALRLVLLAMSIASALSCDNKEATESSIKLQQVWAR